MRNILLTAFALSVIVGSFYGQQVQGQLTGCTLFDGKVVILIRADDDCIGYADAKLTEGGLKIIAISNGTIYLEKEIVP